MKKFALSVLLLAVILPSMAQTAVSDTVSSDASTRAVDSLLRVAADYQGAYQFDLACNCLSQACVLCSDSLQMCVVSENLESNRLSLEMVRRASRPVVKDRRNFSAEDFYLYYPLEDRSWRPVEGQPPYYYPGDAPDTVFVAADPYDAVYPMECGDRRYFASRTLKGMGGYDLFVQYRDDSGWTDPENLGFPFSSPYDDVLFIDTPDGFSFFASNRDCGPDSVTVYVIEHSVKFETVHLSDPEDFRAVASLLPEPTTQPENTLSEEPVTDATSDLMARFQACNTEMLAIEKELASLQDVERLVSLKTRHKLLEAEIQDIMQEFMRDGIEFETEQEEPALESLEVEGSAGGYEFERHNLGTPITVVPMGENL